MNAHNILVIDDEKEIVELIEIYLKNEGYQVYKASCGTEGLEVLEKEKIDLLILDIMMPGIDGLETCRVIRQKRNLPIIMLSAKSQDMDKILGLGMGADDYMTKPFNPMELIARVKLQMRRYLQLNSQNSTGSDIQLIRVKDIVINKKNHKVTLFGREVNLTPTEYEILLLLSENAGTLYSTEQIFEN